MGEICFGCFASLNRAGVCPHCGYDPREDIGKYPAALSAGTILNGKYILGRVLGQGGFGITYAAQDFSTKQRVAIKEFLPTAIASREATGQVSSFGSQRENYEHGKEGFMEEANALVDFKNNPHIVSVFDLFEANGTVYFVMEYVQGRNLKSYVKMMGGRLGEDAVNHILLPIMEALEDVHSKGLVHRDIAPDNIIVTADNSAKLIDFGAARYSTGEKSLSLDVVLKHGYAPKEQYMRRGRQGPFTDVYAMAATYYYAVTGRVPPDAIERGDADELYAPSTLGVKLSPHVEEALLKALEIQPAYRFQTIGEFARAIKGETATTVPPPAPVTPQPIAAPEPIKKEFPQKSEAPGKKKSKKPLVFTFAAVLAVVALVFGFALMQPKETAEPDPVEPELVEPELVEPWHFDETTGTLTINGEGRMEDVIPGYDISNLPWKDKIGNIEKVVIDDGITSVGDFAFSQCNRLTEIVLPDSVTNIGFKAFYGCSSVTEIVIPNSVTSIGDSAFYGCSSLTDIVIPDSVTSIGWYAFCCCSSLTEIVLPDSVTNIGYKAFYGCSSVTEIVIPNSVTSIGDSTFYGCSSLTEIVLPDSVTNIGGYAFYGCSSLTEIVIPDSVTFVGYLALNGIKDIYYGGSKAQWDALDIDCTDDAQIHYNYTG